MHPRQPDNNLRAPGLAQSWYSHTTTAIQNGTLVEIGNFPVANRASRIFGAKPLKEETSRNLSAGLAYSPRRNLNFTVDVYRITIANYQVTAVRQPEPVDDSVDNPLTVIFPVHRHCEWRMERRPTPSVTGIHRSIQFLRG